MSRASSAPATRCAKTARTSKPARTTTSSCRSSTANPNAVGIFGYSFLEENLDKLKGAVVDGVSPTFETIASGKYPGLASAVHLREEGARGRDPRAFREFIAEYTSDKALGEEGYLADKGLIPPTKSEIGKIRADAKALKPLKL